MAKGSKKATKKAKPGKTAKRATPAKAPAKKAAPKKAPPKKAPAKAPERAHEAPPVEAPEMDFPVHGESDVEHEHGPETIEGEPPQLEDFDDELE